MKIDDSLKVKSGLASASTETKANKGSGQAVAVEKSSEDKVTISSRSSELQSLSASVALGEAFDVKKVEEIKAAILDGQFTIDSNKVADGLINSVKDMLNAQKK